jgi:hypothetical protein
VRRGRSRDEDRIDAAGVEQRAVIGMDGSDAVPRRHCLAHGSARVRECRDPKSVEELEQVLQVLGLGDHATADDADSDRIRTVHERGLYAAS